MISLQALKTLTITFSSQKKMGKFAHYANIHSKMGRMSPDLDAIGIGVIKNALIITRTLTWEEIDSTYAQ